MGIGHGLQLKGLEGRMLGMAASSPESFEKLTALRLAAGAGLGETSFQITFALKLRWSVEHPFKGGGAGSLQAAPLPLPPSLSQRGLGSQPSVCPSLNPTTLSLSLSWSLSPTQHQTLFLQARWWFGYEVLDLFSSRGGLRRGKRRCRELGAREGSLLAKAPGRPFSSSPCPPG